VQGLEEGRGPGRGNRRVVHGVAGEASDLELWTRGQIIKL
jgi:hypothetical protein